MTKYALIIEGSWCGTTHIQGFYDTFPQVLIAVRDFVEDSYKNEVEQAKLLMEFADNDFGFIEEMLTIDEVIIEDGASKVKNG